MARRPPFSTRYTVNTPGPETVVDFVKVAAAPASRVIWANVQPLDAKALEDVPEGLRSRARYACFTYEELRSADLDTLPETVTVHGEEYEVHGGFGDGRFAFAPIPGNDYILAEPELT